MRSLLMILAAILVPVVGRAQDLPAPTGDTIVPAGARLEKLFTRSAPIQGGLTEGPTAGPDGAIYFSDPRYLGTETRELEHRAVYRVDPDGKVTEITHEVEKPNGIALSPDQRTLYLADHNNGTDRIDPESKTPVKKGAMKIYAFPLGPDGLVNGPRRTLVDFGDQAGCDGMTVDSRGHIYLTARGVKRPGVLVIDPAGKEVAFLPTGQPNQSEEGPVGLPSNVTFGNGDQKQTLYITVDTSLYRIGLKVPGISSSAK